MVSMEDPILLSIFFPIVILCTLLLLNRQRSFQHASSHAVPPSPWRLPLVGNLHQLTVGRATEVACAEAGRRKDVAVVARGRGVVVPGFVLDSLAEDMRRGVAAFEVTLMSPLYGGWDVATCRGKVGDAANLEVPCPYPSWVKAGLPVPLQQPGGFSSGGGGNLPLPSLGRKVVRDVDFVLQLVVEQLS